MDKIEQLTEEMKTLAPLTFLMAPTVAQGFVQACEEALRSGVGTPKIMQVFHDVVAFENDLRSQPSLSRSQTRAIKKAG